MPPRLRSIVCSFLMGLVAACSDESSPTGPVHLAPLQQDPAGSSASASGFTYIVNTSLADAPGNVDPLLRPAITTTATLRNDRAETATVRFGACNVSLVAHKTPDSRGAPVWQSWASEPWEGTYGRGCILPLYERKLASGEELLLGGYSSRVIEILGDSLTDGRYYFSATISVSVAPSGSVSMPAGDFVLDLVRPPLPDSLTHALITYKSMSTVSGGGTAAVQAKVTATLTHAGGSLVEYPRECVVELVAYRSKERRDAAPRSGAPDWRPSRSCSTDWQRIGLNRGESTSFETTAAARDILGSNLPEGTYYFAVVVHTRTRHVWISAGSGVLRR